ncbi:Receptor-type tyrosine-protein phosphatase N2 [Fragariocoptes setiger]|uniref:Receptor-type tyrosine-protein phosphatase N2 n=1 Tax=Fragariocoptes setiger TaxID=1670756 RepID=A0ABQ7S7Z1_9ACAR|nr:Receptor-type tyrosine-protein phosphatase N2 [Fragariocoptes setiger]
MSNTEHQIFDAQLRTSATVANPIDPTTINQSKLISINSKYSNPNEHVLALTNPLIGQDSMLDDAVGAQTTLMDSNSINNGPAASLSAHVFGNRAAVLPPRVANGGAGAAAVAAILRRPSSATSAGWLADRTWAIVSAILGALLTFVLVALLFRHRGAVKRKVGSSYQDLSDSKPIDSSDGDCEANLTKRRSLCSKLGSFSATISGILSGHASQSTPNQAAAIVHSNNNSSTQTSSPIVKENSTELTSQMDISAAHMILAYMEEHLNDKRRLERDWRALSTYKTEPRATTCALLASNRNKNRQFAAAAANNGNSSANNEDANVPKSLPYDHSLVLLNESMNSNHGDYINASAIYDYDPRRPTHIITQAPMAHTVADFWQMIWEQGSSVIVMLTRLNENNVNMCHCYWPNDPKVPNETHGHFEVHLVSEHIICAEYLVRSIYLMNLKTFETRTVTQFHYLAWPEDSVPANVTNFLEFRRNGGAPIVVHCSDGTGRSGTYTLIDMVLNRISEGAKEIDIAASLEHLRDQRMGVVANMKQFEFVLVAVAAEVQAILDALPQ